jgi:DNA modification methylase
MSQNTSLVYRIYNGDYAKVMNKLYTVYACAIADPPDNIGLKYAAYDDNLDDHEYDKWLSRVMWQLPCWAGIVWLSFNAKHIISMGKNAYWFRQSRPDIDIKPCVQTFTFGQQRNNDLSNCHRPLWRFKRDTAPIYPEQAKVASWRQLNGDKRAAPGGKVPSDVFDFPRVTGNSKQRRAWHPTQLNEELIERCILLSTKEGDHVLDPFAGTGTTLRVCRRLNRSCTLIEIDENYCENIAKEHNLTVLKV